MVAACSADHLLVSPPWPSSGWNEHRRRRVVDEHDGAERMRIADLQGLTPLGVAIARGAVCRRRPHSVSIAAGVTVA